MASSQGLGKSVALELAREGAEVTINGRNEESLIQASNQLSELTGSRVHYIVGDISKRSECHRIVEELNVKMGVVDILVTNSGGPPFGFFDDHDENAWQKAYRLLLESIVIIIKGVLPAMKRKKWGRIITITSQAVKQPVEGLILSNAVRLSVVGLVKTLANELGPHNITVNNVMPGYTRTKRLENLIAKNPDFSSAIRTIPLGRIASTEEFAAAVAFLASERASYITGVSLPVDGGWIKGV